MQEKVYMSENKKKIYSVLSIDSKKFKMLIGMKSDKSNPYIRVQTQCA